VVSPCRRFGTTCWSRVQVVTDVSGQPVGPVFKSLPTFRDNLSVPYSGPYGGFGTTRRSRTQVLTEVSGQLVGPVLKSLPTFRDTCRPVFKSLPRFRDNLSVPSSSPYRHFGTPVGPYSSTYQRFGTPCCPVFKPLPRFLDNLLVPHSSPYRRFGACPSNRQAITTARYVTAHKRTVAMFAAVPAAGKAPAVSVPLIVPTQSLRHQTQQLS
jgi:hypothetical protein